MNKIFSKVLKNRVFGFVALKYIAFGIQMVNALLIAKLLGLYFFGLYGFLTLFLQYISYANLGVNYSYNVLYSGTKNITEIERAQITNGALFSLVAISLILLMSYGLFQDSTLFEKYDFQQYALYILLIGILQYFNTLYINISRLRGRIKEINIYYFLLPFSQLLMCLIFEKDKLFWALIYAMLIANAVGLLIFAFRHPIAVLKGTKFVFISKLIKRGFFLLFYNLSFYGILISAKTLVSHFYAVEKFALFNFSNSLSQAVFMLLGSLNFLFYPKLLNVISRKENDGEMIGFIEKIRKYYLTLTLMIVLLSMLVLPIILSYLSEYKDAFLTIQLLLLAQLLINNCFGYSTLLVQRGKERLLTLLAMIAIVIVVSISYTAYYLISPGFEMVALAVVVAVMVYNLLVTIYGNKVTGQFSKFSHLLLYVYRWKLFAPVLLFIILSVLIDIYYFNLGITIALYLILNFKEIKEITFNSIKLVQGKDLFEIK